MSEESNVKDVVDSAIVANELDDSSDKESVIYEKFKKASKEKEEE